MTYAIVPSSFRDPSGFLFRQDGLLYRQINNCYKDNYEHLVSSGLYKALVGAGLLIPHEEVDIVNDCPRPCYKIIKPQVLPFISYPYEWSFSQLKDAALSTLQIQKESLSHGMSLKDCSAYNIQFRKGKVVFIDTLSFEKYKEGRPWVGYRQFCQHFLAPLALMSYKDIRLNQLLRIFIDGIPLDLASSLMPPSSYLDLSMILHIHIHAKSQKHFADKTISINGNKMTRLSLLGVVDSLESAVRKMRWRAKGTEWADYYTGTNYSEEAFQDKKKIISEFLDIIRPKSVWDIGANTGVFSRIASQKMIPTISFDIDPAAVEKNYTKCIKDEETAILPLLLDLSNPSPGIGWDNNERISLTERGPADTVMALALIHHLAISNNIPFDKIAVFLSKVCENLIIEFVPKSDSQVKKLLTSREDIFDDYKQEIFENVFNEYFTINKSLEIKGTERTVYLMHKR